jgi:hypothetical protein
MVVAGVFDWPLPGGRYTPGTLARLNGDGSVRWIRKDNVLARIGEDDASRAMAVVVAADGGIAIAGCTRVWEISTLRGGEASEARRQGFVVGFSAGGEQRWTYALDAGTGHSSIGVLQLGQREQSGACGTAVAVGPAHDIFAAGTFLGPIPMAKRPGMPERGSFLVRFSPQGQPRWSQVISPYPTTPRLAGLPGGKVVVAGALEAGAEASGGLVAYDPGGTRLWQLKGDFGQSELAHHGSFVASRGGTVFWAGRVYGKTTLGRFVLEGPEPPGACAFVARCDQDGKVSSVAAIQGGATCAPTALASGRRPWLAGGWFGAHDDGTYVHRIRFPEADR